MRTRLEVLCWATPPEPGALLLRAAARAHRRPTRRWHRLTLQLSLRGAPGPTADPLCLTPCRPPERELYRWACLQLRARLSRRDHRGCHA